MINDIHNQSTTRQEKQHLEEDLRDALRYHEARIINSRMKTTTREDKPTKNANKELS